MHEHLECGHELKYCKICDTVYCEKCGKEWKTNSSTSPWIITYNPVTYSPTYDSDQTVSFHSHNSE